MTPTHCNRLRGMRQLLDGKRSVTGKIRRDDGRAAPSSSTMSSLTAASWAWSLSKRRSSRASINCFEAAEFAERAGLAMVGVPELNCQKADAGFGSGMAASA